MESREGRAKRGEELLGDGDQAATPTRFIARHLQQPERRRARAGWTDRRREGGVMLRTTHLATRRQTGSQFDEGPNAHQRRNTDSTDHTDDLHPPDVEQRVLISKKKWSADQKGALERTAKKTHPTVEPKSPTQRGYRGARVSAATTTTSSR